jgi:hypothetical protein
MAGGRILPRALEHAGFGPSGLGSTSTNASDNENVGSELSSRIANSERDEGNEVPSEDEYVIDPEVLVSDNCLRRWEVAS